MNAPEAKIHRRQERSAWQIPGLNPWWTRALLLLGYLALASYAIAVSQLDGGIATFWYANAYLAMVAYLQPRTDRRMTLVAGLFANFCVNVAFGSNVPVAMAFALVNAVEVWLALYLAVKYHDTKRLIESPKRTFFEMLLIIGLPVLLGGLSGVSLLQFLGVDGEFGPLMLTWVFGDVVGYASLLPIAVLLSYGQSVSPLEPVKPREYLILAVSIVAGWLDILTFTQYTPILFLILIATFLYVTPLISSVALLLFGLASPLVTRGLMAPDASADLTYLATLYAPHIAALIGAGVLLIFIQSTHHSANAMSGALEERMQLFKTVPVGFLEVEGGIIKSMNTRFSEISGYTPTDLVGKTLADLIDASDSALAGMSYKNWREFRRDKRVVFQTQLPAKDGRQLHVEVGAVLVDTHRMRITFAFLDLTALETERLALRASRDEAYKALNDLKISNTQIEQLYSERSAILESSLVGLAAARDGKIFWANEQFANIFGYSADNLQDVALSAVLSGSQNESGTYLQLTERLQTQGVYINTLKLPRADGTWTDIEIRAKAVQPDAKNIYLSARDVAQELTNMRELRLAHEAAQSASRAKSEFLSTMSHEIRTPLNGVMGTLQLLEMDPNLSERSRRYVDTCMSASELLLTLLNDTLDLTSLNSRHLNLDMQPTWLHDSIHLVEEITRGAAAGKELALQFSVPDDLHVRVLTDQRRLQQMMLNLLNNAVKFTERGFVRLTARIMKRTDTHIDVEITVEDSGIGISQEHLGELFTPFYQINSGIDRSFGGTGLGLSITQQLARMMGGNVVVKSELGFGSRFALRLNFQLVESKQTVEDHHPTQSSNFEVTAEEAGEADEVVDKPEVAPYRVADLFVGKAFLVVDDKALNCEIAENLLRLLGAEVYKAFDGREAVDFVENSTRQVDAILMDLQMDRMSGFEAARLIRRLPDARKAQIPIAAMTGSLMNAEREAALASGMQGFVTKPLKVHELTAALLKLLNEHTNP